MPDVQENSLQTTADTLFEGEIFCRQFKKGYRFSVDAVLAAHFQPPGRGERVLDLGAGCGVIGLIMMYRWKQKIEILKSLELQPELAELTNRNYAENGFGVKCSCIQGDVNEILGSFPPEFFSLVVCNPPFYKEQTGRQSQNVQSRIARHQLTADITVFSKGAAAVLKNGGSAVFIYPADQFMELAAALADARLEIKELQFVYSYPSKKGNARLVLVRCVKNGGSGVKIKEPFYIYEEKNGAYNAEMAKLFAPQ